jgi:hypothetical protein
LAHFVLKGAGKAANLGESAGTGDVAELLTQELNCSRCHPVCHGDRTFSGSSVMGLLLPQSKSIYGKECGVK